LLIVLTRIKVQGSGFKVQGSRFRVQGSGFKVQGSVFSVQCLRFKAKNIKPVRTLSPEPQTLNLER